MQILFFQLRDTQNKLDDTHASMQKEIERIEKEHDSEIQAAQEELEKRAFELSEKYEQCKKNSIPLLYY